MPVAKATFEASEPEDDSPSPKSETRPSDKSTTVVKQRNVLIDATHPPYDEEPLDIGLGPHFLDDGDWSWNLTPRSPAETALVDRFREMASTLRETLSQTVTGLVCLCINKPFDEPSARPFIRVGTNERDDWSKVHNTIIQTRDEWFPELDLPIRYFQYIESFEEF